MQAPGTASLHCGQLRKRFFGVFQDLIGLAACGAHKVFDDAAVIFEQNLQKMFGLQKLVIVAKSERLRCLHNRFCTFGKFFEVHCGTP